MRFISFESPDEEAAGESLMIVESEGLMTRFKESTAPLAFKRLRTTPLIQL
jgi:hypothetical protein